MATFTIQGRLPSANEFIRWDRIRGARNMPIRFWGAKKRREALYHVAAYIMQAAVPKFDGPVDMSVKWVEPNRRRDFDNIQSGVKSVLDALVKTRTIKGDSRRWIPNPVRHEFALDRDNPRIEVTINEYAPVSGSGMSRPA